MRACVRLDGQKACRAWQESYFWQQLQPQFYILRWCLDSAPALLSPALMFSIRRDHKLLSAVITAVHCGPAEGSQPVLVHQVTLDGGTTDMGSRKDLWGEQGTTQKLLKGKCTQIQVTSMGNKSESCHFFNYAKNIWKYDKHWILIHVNVFVILVALSSLWENADKVFVQASVRFWWKGGELVITEYKFLGERIL